MPIFTADEIRRRHAVIISQLHHADCIVIPSFHGSFYASGFPMRRFGRFCITMLFRDGPPVVIAPVFEESGVREHSPIADVRLYDDGAPPIQATTDLVGDVLTERDARIVGIEAHDMPAAMARRLRERLPHVGMGDETAALDEARLVSSTEEIAYLEQAVGIADVGMEALLERLRPGASERELAAAAVRAMDDAVGDGVDASTRCYMQQNERSAECHASAMAVPIGTDGFVELLVECEVWHYQASVERPVLLARPGRAVERACRVARDALEAARRELAPGVAYAAVDAASRRVLHDAGYEHVMSGAGLVRNVIHHTGGRLDGGELRPYNTRCLAAGTSLTIEPWALIPGVGGPRFCDPVVITQDGWRRLSRVPDELSSVTQSRGE